MSERAFSLRPIPRRLMRSLWSFAGAGTLMAVLVYRDGSFGAWVPAVMLAGCWAVPLVFFVQIRRQGFDPLVRMVATEAGLEAHYRAERVRFIPWHGMRHLVQIEGYRQRGWAITTDDEPLRWFGELEDPEGFAALVAERTGLAWEVRTDLPD